MLAAAALLAAAPATAKDFRPGDLRLCDATHCVPIRDAGVLAALSRFYYVGPAPPLVASSVQEGAVALRLEFRNGYVTGIVATPRLDHFLSYGVNLERFEAGVWYRVPAPAARELQRLARALRPLRLTRGVIAASR